jgi:hypothetical protein
MRTIRNKILAAALAGSAVVAGFAMPSHAATDATFDITGGTLSIVEPASTVALGSTTAGAALFSAQLGDVTVNDDRGALVAAWTTTVSSTDFTTGTAGVAETVLNAAISYDSGAGTALAGEDGTFVGSAALSLGAPGSAATWAGTGVNHVTWNPTLSFALLVNQVAGTYAGTITHSVA